MVEPKVFKNIEFSCRREKENNGALEHFIVPYKKNKYILYFPLKGVIFIVNKHFINIIDTDNFVVKTLFNQVSKIHNIKRVDHGDFVDYLCLELTKACNLNCTYCYARGGDDPKFMDWKTAKAAMDWKIKGCETKQFRLEFHGGGEPLIAFPMMKRCYEYAKKKCAKKGIIVKPQCATNGTLLTEDIVKWFKQIGMAILLSFDGLPEMQNKQRPFRDGTGSYDTMKRAIKLLNKYKQTYKSNCTVTKDSVSSIINVIENLHKLGVKNCNFNYVQYCGRYECAKKLVYQEFNYEMKKASKLAKKYKIKMTDREKLYRSFFEEISDESCGSSGHTVAVTTDGDISSCLSVVDPLEKSCHEFFFGKIRNGKVIINQKKLNHLRNRNVNNMESCKNCFAKYICRGCCLCVSSRGSGTIYKPSEEECTINKERAMQVLMSIIKEPTIN